jgi:hypothetical protein
MQLTPRIIEAASVFTRKVMRLLPRAADEAMLCSAAMLLGIYAARVGCTPTDVLSIAQDAYDATQTTRTKN